VALDFRTEVTADDLADSASRRVQDFFFSPIFLPIGVISVIRAR
jgi:hypothetical protein